MALSLMGFDSGILQDATHPVWLYQEGYDDFFESWKSPQTPQSWLKTSCVWFSRVLAEKLGSEKFQVYLAILDYGNQDASGGLTSAWLSSSLQISPREQVEFIRKMIQGEHPISSYATQMTRQSLFVDELACGWKLFGKTALGDAIDTPDGKQELGWFIGWVEKKGYFFPFAYTIQEKKINLGERIPRVKQLLMESALFNDS